MKNKKKDLQSLRLLVFTQGEYGSRILGNISKRKPLDWTIGHENISRMLPPVIEEPEKFIDHLDLSGEWDLILFLGESPSAFSLLPAIAMRASFTAVIAPADDYSWLPIGLERQICSKLEDIGVDVTFPRPFCALMPKDIPVIDEFVKFFGSPILKIETKDEVIRRVEVLRGAPCGSTWYLAEKLPGIEEDRASDKGALLVQTYPCLASRRIDRIFSDSPIHVAGHIAVGAVNVALKVEKQE